MTIYSGFSHWTWGFSIVMLVYQRVYIYVCVCLSVYIRLYSHQMSISHGIFPTKIQVYPGWFRWQIPIGNSIRICQNWGFFCEKHRETITQKSFGDGFPWVFPWFFHGFPWFSLGYFMMSCLFLGNLGHSPEIPSFRCSFHSLSGLVERTFSIEREDFWFLIAGPSKCSL